MNQVFLKGRMSTTGKFMEIKKKTTVFKINTIY